MVSLASNCVSLELSIVLSIVKMLLFFFTLIFDIQFV